MKQSKQCKQCGKLFFKKYESNEYWAKRKYCSTRCSGIAWREHPAPKSAFRKGHKSWNEGLHISLNNCLKKWREETGGEGKNHPNWKGNKAKYSAIHMWIKLHKTRTGKCANCGKTGNNKQIHWSNIDHKYRRNLDDYVERCVPCHKKYDLENGLCQH